MRYDSITLLEELQADIRRIIQQSYELLQKDPELLMQAPAPGKWSVAQVIEHLNSYNRYYLAAMESGMLESKEPASKNFSPGWLGDFFTKSMQPKANGTVANKMQAPKNHRPPVDIDSKKAIDEFIEGGHKLLQLLDKARGKNLGRIRIPITLSKFIRLKLGDTFRFLIAHQQRHFVQIDRTLEALSQPGSAKNIQQALR